MMDKAIETFLLSQNVSNGVRTAIEVAEINFSGAINRRDFAVNEVSPATINPLFDVASDQAYERRLSKHQGWILPINNDDKEIVINSEGEPELNWSAIELATSHSTTLSDVGSDSTFRPKDWSVVKNGGQQSHEWFSDDSLLVQGAWNNASAYTSPFQNSESYNAQFVTPGFHLWSNMPPMAQKALDMVDRGNSDWATNIPLESRVCKIGERFSNMHYIKGYRRVFIVTGGKTYRSQNFIGILIAYLEGSGDDIICKVNAVADPNDVAIYWTQDACGYPKGWEPYDAIKASNSKRFFPITGLPMFIDRFVGRITSYPVEEILLEGVNVYYRRYDYEVTQMWGSIVVEDYQEYLSSGYGVLQGLKPERLQVVMQSWSKLGTQGISYAYTSNKCNGRSLTSTAFYKEYANQRKKSCRDNDYMKLRFNAEYTNQQVEDKLRSLVTKNVWIQPVSAMGAAPSRLTFLKVVSIETVNANQFAATSGGLVNTFTKNEDGLDKFYSAYPNHQITDPEGIIAGLIGVDEDGTNVAQLQEKLSGGYSIDKYDMRAHNLSAGYALSYADVLKVLDNDAQVAYLCSQVTDYANFELMLMRLFTTFELQDIMARRPTDAA